MYASKAINSKINMCDKCSQNFAVCKPELIKYGNGKGNDNVIVCSSFITMRLSGDHDIHISPELGSFRRDISDPTR